MNGSILAPFVALIVLGAGGGAALVSKPSSLVAAQTVAAPSRICAGATSDRRAAGASPR
jgi:hypothetical protein